MSLSLSSHSSAIKANDQPAMEAATTAENSQLSLKGKRTKRGRSHQPQQSPAATTSSSATSSSVAEASGSSTTSSAVLTEEEEDMANCLILLAQGQGQPSSLNHHQEPPLTKFSYECKTCSKCFPTFQALGGHRASHKKIKTTAATDQDKPPPPRYIDSSIAKLMTSATTKQRLHECSICGLEFTSGQALGGHMRRHRPAVVAEPTQVNKEKNLLSWDLNLPAPEEVAAAAAATAAQDNGNDGLFVFPTSKQQQPILLVDCHN